MVKQVQFEDKKILYLLVNMPKWNRGEDWRDSVRKLKFGLTFLDGSDLPR
jgi:hypothetical protein